MSDGFGPYSKEELDAILAPSETRKEYETQTVFLQAVERYREFCHHYQEEIDNGVEEADRHLLEVARRRLHQQTFDIARSVGRTGSEVFSELLRLNKTLEDRKLPEFAVAHRDDFYEQRSFSDQEIERLTTTVEEVENVPVVRDLQRGEAGIIFTRSVTKRIPNISQFASVLRSEGYVRLPGNDVALEQDGERERIRRAALLAKRLDVPMLIVNTFSHNYSETLYGVAVDERSIDVVASEIRNHRAEFGIRETDLPQEVVERDRALHETELRKLRTDERMVYDHEFKKIYDPKYRASDAKFAQEALLNIRKEERRELDTKRGKRR